MKTKILFACFICLILASCSFFPNQKEQNFITAKGRYFFLEDKHFLPIGENVAWLDSIEEYDYYFSKLSNNSANTVRVIMVPWNTDIEWDSLGEYNKERIEKIDQIISLAEKYNLYVILSFDIYGELKTESHDSREMLWKENPYNKLKGGPCENPEDFFTSKEAKKFYKKRINFIVSTYKEEDNIFAYELWNEADITDNFNIENYMSWQNEIVQFIKEKDSNHLVSSSFANPYIDDLVWTDLDFVQIHYHGSDAYEKLPILIKEKKELNKPILFSEFSLGNNASINKQDKDGEILYNAMITASAQGVGVFPWWWDENIEENNLYYIFESLNSHLKSQNNLFES